MSANWQDVDGITFARSQTNIPTTPNAFYRVVSVAAAYAGRNDTKPPSVPAELTATAVSCDRIHLSWAASTDPNPAPTAIKGYNLYRGGVFLKQVLAPATSTSDSGLAASTEYTYAVSAVDNSLNQSAKSSLVAATTPGCGACAYSISPTNSSFASEGGSGFASVSTSAGCSWTVTANASWISITAGGSGSGNGTVNYSVSTNTTTLSRAGTLTVAGQTLNIWQAAALSDNPPTTSLTAPASGSIVSGATAFSGTATDDVGVVRVEFWSDGSELLGTDTTPPYSASYDTTSLANGTHNFTTKAYDTAGQSTISAAVPLTVNNDVSPPGQLQWVRSMTNLFGASVIAKAVSTDRSGNSISVGQFSSTADFGGGPVSVDGVGFFIAKYTDQNGFVWAKSFAQTGESSGYSVVADSRDNIIVTGFFTGTKDFGGVTLKSTTNQVGSASPDIFIAKYSPSGGLMWVTNYGGPYSDMGYAVAVDASDSIFLATKFQVTADFGGVTLTSSGNSTDIALAKLSSTGAMLWVRRRGGNYDDYVYGLAADSSGDIVVTGGATGPCDLGNGPTPTGGILLAKYSGADGSYRWGKAMGGSAGKAVAVDPNTANIIITGGFQGSVDFGDGPLPGQSGMAMFLASYDTSGANLWARTWGGAVQNGSDQGFAIAIDENGNLALTGQIISPMDFGGGWLFGNGNPNYFVASFMIAGNSPPVHRWARRSGSGTNGSGSGNGISYDLLGNVLTTGFYLGTVDFGGTSVSSPISYAAFVARYAR
jgi:hypothetical protein